MMMTFQWIVQIVWISPYKQLSNTTAKEGANIRRCKCTSEDTSLSTWLDDMHEFLLTVGHAHGGCVWDNRTFRHARQVSKLVLGGGATDHGVDAKKLAHAPLAHLESDQAKPGRSDWATQTAKMFTKRVWMSEPGSIPNGQPGQWRWKYNAFSRCQNSKAR